MVAGGVTFALHWGLPVAAMLGVIPLQHPTKTWVWLAALVWMGLACLRNARRCARTHCYFTGPFFLAMTIPASLHGFGIWSLGDDGWRWLGMAIGIGGGGIWCVTEKLWGRYLAEAPERNPRRSN